VKHRRIHTAEIEQALFEDPFVGETRRAVQVDSPALGALGQHEDDAARGDELGEGQVVRLLQNRSYLDEISFGGEPAAADVADATGIHHLFEEEPGLAVAFEDRRIRPVTVRW